MKTISVEMSLTVDIEIADTDAEALTADDVRSMVCNVVGHNHHGIATQLIINDVAQYYPEKGNPPSDADPEPMMVNAWVDVNWGSIENAGCAERVFSFAVQDRAGEE